ncbi:hypothetical protein R0137_12205 [Congregibacter brevis]|uniref:Uncharacterized protein n=1 Tax=Congregibacter brevis TaxID=3081201 RepID=A0ABZ0IC90_9GAMM|nr:hypothetical protein R0137_12205 [Congregibacter sp. IMCC45268]
MSNWNEARSAKEHEHRLLVELSSEIEQNSKRTRTVGDGLLVGGAAARRVLSLIENQVGCEDDCWPVVVDLMHASQWQRPNIRRTTYDELRRAGLPSDRRIIESFEQYQAIHDRATFALETPPAYRSFVRQLLPIDLQDRYWQSCYIEDGGSERYLYPCAPSKDAGPVDRGVVEKVLDNAQLALLLREWTSIALVTGNALAFDQSAAAQAAINAIKLTIGEEA